MIDFTVVTSFISFQTVILAVLGIFGSVAVLVVVQIGAMKVLEAILGSSFGRYIPTSFAGNHRRDGFPGYVYYRGRYWRRDVYNDAMRDIQSRVQRGGRLDRDTAYRYERWR